MIADGQRAGMRAAFGVGVAILLVASLSSPAAAASLFERLFGAFRHYHQAPPAESRAFVDPFTPFANHFNPPQERRGESGSQAFCVRTCDGRYFRVQSSPGMSAAEACHSFCPASQTQLYFGGDIDYATARDGSRYADSANAFVYRKQLIAGCTCNGRDAFGLAHIDAGSDPTLRAGDVVATKNGLMAYTGANNKTADFTPVENDRALSSSERARLSRMKVQQNTPMAADSAVSRTLGAPTDDNRSAQLNR